MHHQHKTISKRLQALIGRLRHTVPPERRNEPLVAPAVQPGQRHVNAQTASGPQPDMAGDPAATRKAEIERLLAQSGTPSTALSFLHGLSVLSAPAT
jgi:hypothetical protein